MSISWHKKRQNHIRRIPVNLYNRVEQKLKNSDLLSKKREAGCQRNKSEPDQMPQMRKDGRQKACYEAQICLL